MSNAVNDHYSDGDVDSDSTLNPEIAYNLLLKLCKRAGFDVVDNAEIPLHVGQTNLILLACRYDEPKVLKLIFDKHNISVSVNPDETDTENHNVFYYSIRSNNVKLLDLLINKWPGKYFDSHSEELDGLLAKAYEEIILKKLEVTKEMQIFVEDMLIKLRFIRRNLKVENDRRYANLELQVQKRIDLVCQNIASLNSEYYDEQITVDTKFLLMSTFIAKNIRLLKRQLQFTYDILPWEEIEFCLVSFISAHTNQQEINLVFHASLNKQKLLGYLMSFMAKLCELKDILKDYKLDNDDNKLPEKTREQIAQENPAFEELYNVHDKIRDIYSLKQIAYHIKLLLSKNYESEVSQLVVERALQVTGEYLKNSLTSPNLSKTVSELILLSLPRHTSEMLKDLRNSLSHSHLIAKRLEIAKKEDPDFFPNIRYDFKKIGVVIADIFYKNKIETIRMLLERIDCSSSLQEIRSIGEMFKNIDFEKLNVKGIQTTEHADIKTLMELLDDTIKDKTPHEMRVFQGIRDVFSTTGNLVSLGNKSILTPELQYGVAVNSFATIVDCICNESSVDTIKTKVENYIKKLISVLRLEKQKYIVDLALNFVNSIQDRFEGNCVSEEFKKIDHLLYKIFYAAHLGEKEIKWIEKLKKNFMKKNEDGETFLALEEKQTKLENIVNRAVESLNVKLIPQEEAFNIFKDELQNKMNQEFCFALQFDKTKSRLVQLFSQLIELSDKTKKSSTSKNESKTRIEFEKENRREEFKNLCMELDFERYKQIIQKLQKHFNENDWVNGKRITEKKLVTNDYGKLLDSLDNVEKASKAFKKFSDSLNGDIYKIEINAFFIKEMVKTLKGKVTITAEEHLSHSDSKLTKMLDSLKIKLNISESTDKLVQFYESNQEQLVELKVIVLDIIEILNSKALVEDNSNFLNNYCPILIGKQLRNYLAHGDHLIDVLQFDPLRALICNAKQIVTNEREIIGGNKIGEFVDNDLSRLEKQYKESLEIAMNQNDLFVGAETGCMECIQSCLEKGADIDGKDINYWNVLHYASRGNKVNVFQFFLNHNANLDAKNIEGEKPLHVAARYGSIDVVLLLLHDPKVNLRDVDDAQRTVLHLAAQKGYEVVLKTLLEHIKENCPNEFREFVNAKTDVDVTPLHLAALYGHEGTVNLLLQNNAVPDAEEEEGWTALHLAAQNGYLEIVVALINKNANVDHQTADENVTPLHLAAQNGHIEVVKTLLQSNAGVNSAINSGYTALHLASQNGHLKIVKALLEADAEVNAHMLENGFTPLHLAAGGGHLAVVMTLVDMKAEIESKILGFGKTPLWFATQNGHLDVVKYLVYEKNADYTLTDEEGYAPIHWTALNGNLDIAKVLFEKIDDVDVPTGDGFTPLHLATQNGHLLFVCVLLEKGAKVTCKTIAQKCTPLHVAALGHPEITRCLLQTNVDVDLKMIDDWTALHVAAKEGKLEVVKVLLDGEADIFARTSDSGSTPLHIAATYDRIEIVETLLQRIKKRFPDTYIRYVNSLCHKGWTPLHLAAQSDCDDIVKSLMRNGAEVNAKAERDWTALHLAAQNGHRDVVAVLLNGGADINTVNFEGNTPLHSSVFSGNADVVELLLKKVSAANVDNFDNFVNAKNLEGVTPLYLAVKNSLKDVVTLLLRNKADVFTRAENRWTVLHCIPTADVAVLLLEHIRKNTDMLDEFVNARNEEHLTPLHCAAYNGLKGVVTVLLHHGADVNGQGAMQLTALHLAAQNGHRSVIDVLLDNGADIEAKTSEEVTPLFFAVRLEDADIVRYLVEKGSNCLSRDVHGTVLHAAAVCGSEVILRMVLVRVKEQLNHDAAEIQRSVNAPDADGDTPLMWAAQSGRPESIEVLLEFGADIEARNEEGATALTWAAKGNHTEAALVLLRNGANPRDLDNLYGDLENS